MGPFGHLGSFSRRHGCRKRGTGTRPPLSSGDVRRGAFEVSFQFRFERFENEVVQIRCLFLFNVCLGVGWPHSLPTIHPHRSKIRGDAPSRRSPKPGPPNSELIFSPGLHTGRLFEVTSHMFLRCMFNPRRHRPFRILPRHKGGWYDPPTLPFRP